MQNFSSVRVLALSVALVFGLALSARAQDDFKILGVSSFHSNDLIWVKNAWRKDLPNRIQATLRVETDTPAKSIFVKAYFYDSDDKLVATVGQPNKIWTATGRGMEEVGLPSTLSHVKTTEVYFALPEDIVAKKWKTVLVVFGNSTKAAACANPATEMEKLNYPEKAIVPPPAL